MLRLPLLSGRLIAAAVPAALGARPAYVQPAATVFGRLTTLRHLRATPAAAESVESLLQQADAAYELGGAQPQNKLVRDPSLANKWERLSGVEGKWINYSTRSRAKRLKQALEACARGEEFHMPEPELVDMPGPCGAVMQVLEDRGPLQFEPLFQEINERYPGVLSTPEKFKQKILLGALVHKLMLVRHGDSIYKDSWALKKPGQIRMSAARGQTTRPSTNNHIGKAGGKAARGIVRLTRRGMNKVKPNTRGPGHSGRDKKKKKGRAVIYG